MENKTYDEIIGRPDEAPYLNDLATRSALFTNSHGVTHPSQPNYIAMFSGSTQGVTNDDCPKNFINVPNLGADLIQSGFSFAGYSESLPGDGSTTCGSGDYARKHNPWVDFDNVPASSNKTFTEFPKDYSQLPTVSFVTPNLCSDMHDCSRDTGDAWPHTNIDPYAQWARSHNSLLVVTWDEDDNGPNNQIPTLIYGANVHPGNYRESIDHYSMLRTIEDMYSLPHLGQANSRNPITGVWDQRADGPWHAADLTTGSDGNAPAAAGAPFGYTTNLAGQGPVARVVYQATSGHIEELNVSSM
jgi:acid phosphatase